MPEDNSQQNETVKRYNSWANEQNVRYQKTEKQRLETVEKIKLKIECLMTAVAERLPADLN